MRKSGDNKLLARHFNRIGLVSATPVHMKMKLENTVLLKNREDIAT